MCLPRSLFMLAAERSLFQYATLCHTAGVQRPRQRQLPSTYVREFPATRAVDMHASLNGGFHLGLSSIVGFHIYFSTSNKRHTSRRAIVLRLGANTGNCEYDLCGCLRLIRHGLGYRPNTAAGDSGRRYAYIFGFSKEQCT